MDNAYLATAVVLRELKCTSIDNIGDRILLQKKVFLAQELGINLGYGYNWYIHGPYSPDLTSAAYKIIPDGFTFLEEYHLNHDARNIVDKVNNIQNENSFNLENVDWFELVASIAFWYKIKKDKNFVAEKIQQFKPKFNTDAIDGAFSLYSQLKS